MGLDIAWVEEAANISHSSWEILIPTIRKDGSEIWILFNPILEQDATFERFVKRPQPNSLVRHVTYRDNPWFSEELKREAAALRARDPDAYQHIYLGQRRYTLDGAIYANELRDAQEQGRIMSVPYDPTMPVSVYFDLGWQTRRRCGSSSISPTKSGSSTFTKTHSVRFPTTCMSSRSVATPMPRCGCHTTPRPRA